MHRERASAVLISRLADLITRVPGVHRFSSKLIDTCGKRAPSENSFEGSSYKVWPPGLFRALPVAPSGVRRGRARHHQRLASSPAEVTAKVGDTIEWVNGDFVGANAVTSRVFRDCAITRYEFMNVTNYSPEPCTTRFNR